MAHDPFAPPRAELELEEDPGPVPMRVKVAVVVIIAGAVMSFSLRVAMTREVLPPTLPLLLLSVLAWKLFAGRDWARWILLALVGLGAFGLMGMVYWPTSLIPPPPQYVRITSAIQFVLEGTALVLVFSGDARKWFQG